MTTGPEKDIRLDLAGGVDEAVLSYFNDRGWIWSWEDTRFDKVDDDGLRRVRAYLGGWRAGRWAAGTTDVGRDWGGPFFPDPITAFTHAEADDWGRAPKPVFTGTLGVWEGVRYVKSTKP